MMLEAILFNVITLLNVQLVKTQNSKITTQKSQEELLNSLELEKIKRGKKLKGENEQIYVNNQNNVKNNNLDIDNELGMTSDFGNMYPNMKFYRRLSNGSDDSSETAYEENDKYAFSGNYFSNYDDHIGSNLNRKYFKKIISCTKTDLTKKDEYAILNDFLRDFKTNRPQFQPMLMNLLNENMRKMANQLIGVKRIQTCDTIENVNNQMISEPKKEQNLQNNVQVSNNEETTQTVPRRILKINRNMKTKKLQDQQMDEN